MLTRGSVTASTAILIRSSSLNSLLRCQHRPNHGRSKAHNRVLKAVICSPLIAGLAVARRCHDRCRWLNLCISPACYIVLAPRRRGVSAFRGSSVSDFHAARGAFSISGPRFDSDDDRLGATAQRLLIRRLCHACCLFGRRRARCRTAPAVHPIAGPQHVGKIGDVTVALLHMRGRALEALASPYTLGYAS